MFNKLVPFLLLPFLTRHLSTEEFGIVSLVQVLITFFNAAVGSSLQLNISRNIFTLEKNRFSIHLYNTVLVLLANCMLFTLATSAFSIINQDALGIPSRWLLVIPIIAAANMLSIFNQTILRAESRAWTYSAFEISASIVNLTLSLSLVLFLAMGWEGRALGIAIPSLAYGLFSFWFMHKEKRLSYSFHPPDFKQIVIVSIPLFPHAISSMLMSVSDRFFLANMVGPAEVGIYSVGYNFGMVIMLFSDAFAKAWNPWLLRMLAQPSTVRKIKVARASFIYILALMLGTPIYILLAQWAIPLVVGVEFAESSKFIPVICVSYVIFGIYQLFFPFLVLIKKTGFLAFSSVFAAGVNLAANYILIQHYGGMGAAYSTLIAYGISTLCVVWFVTHQYPLPWLQGFRSLLAPLTKSPFKDTEHILRHGPDSLREDQQ